MNFNETAKLYYAAIGDFVVAYAGLEMHLGKFISAKKANAKVQNFNLSVTIAADFDMTKKAAKLDKYIQFHIPKATNQFKKEWEIIYYEVLDITEARHYLVHGLCLGFVYYEPIDTFLSFDKDNMINRKFMLSEIENLTLRTKGIVGQLTGDFWHKYAMFLGYKDYFLTGIVIGDQILAQWKPKEKK